MALVLGMGVGPQPGYAADRSDSAALKPAATATAAQQKAGKKPADKAAPAKQSGKSTSKARAHARAATACDVARIPCCLPRIPCCLTRDICDPGPTITTVEQLDYAADLQVTWTYTVTDPNLFLFYTATADTGQQCQSSTATTCTIEGVPSGSRQITVAAEYDGDEAVGTAYPKTVVAMPVGAQPALTVSFSEVQIRDHRSANVIIDLDRTDTTLALTDLAFQVALPAGLVVADSHGSLTCGGTVSLHEGGSSIQLSAGAINAGQGNCRLRVALTAGGSGVYQLGAGDFSGLAGGVTNAATTQTLTVVAAEPLLTGYFSPDEIAVGSGSTLRLDLGRTDENPTAVAGGLSYAISLPAGVVVAPGRVVANTCGGSATAVAGASTLALSGASLGAAVSDCRLSVAVTATAAGTHSFSDVTSSTGIEALLACLDEVPGDDAEIEGGYCEPTLVATKLTQVLSFSQPSDASVTAGSVNLSASSTSGLNVSYNTGNAQVCTVSGNTVTLVAAGTCSITAVQPGNSAYLPAEAVTRTFAVTGAAPLTQTISFAPAATVALSAGSLALSASASSGLTVAFSSGSPLVCTVAGATLTLLRAGDCVVEASQPGNTAYAPAAPVGRSLTITKDGQAITFGALGAADLSDGTVTAAATASSGLTVTLSSSTPQVCTVAGSTVTLLAAGTCTIAADQPGNDRYLAATPVSRSFPITVTPPAPPAPRQVTATAGISSIEVSWDAPAGSTGITGYTATASPGPATCTTDGATTCVMGGTAGVTYTITVVATGPGGDSGAAGPSGEVTPTAPEPPAQVPVTDLNLTTDKGLITTAEPGQVVVFIGTGFAAFSTVTISIYSDPIVLGTVVTDENGDFSKPITIPPGLVEGAHTAVAQGVAPDGTERSMKLAITVAAAGDPVIVVPGDGGELPVTGVNLGAILLAGLLSLTTGVALLAATRRRRTA